MSFNGIANYNGVLQISILANQVGLWSANPGEGPIPNPGELSGGGYVRLDLGALPWVPWGISQVINKNDWGFTVPECAPWFLTFHHQFEFATYDGYTYDGGSLPPGTYLGCTPIRSGKYACATVAVGGVVTSPVHGLVAGSTVRLLPSLSNPFPKAYVRGAIYAVTVLDADTFTLMDNTVQTLTIGGGPTGGTFTLIYAGPVTTPIAYNPSSSDIQSALEALPTIGTGNVTVTGSGPFTITFTGDLAATVAMPIATNSAALTGGTGAPLAATVTPVGTTVTPAKAGYLYWQLALPYVSSAGGLTIPRGTIALAGMAP